MSTTEETAVQYIHQNREKFLDELKEFATIPSISTDSKYANDIKKSAEWLVDQFRSLGLDNIKIYPTARHPVVYAEYTKAGKQAPTVLIYGHYDVQPADPLDEWDTPPFEPTIRGDYIYGRGISDMKGQVLATIKAVQAIQTTGNLPVNVKFLIEGEEEIGSPHLADFIREHKDMLSCDFALNPDTGMIAPGVPTVTYALRGLAFCELHVYGPKQDVHSGREELSKLPTDENFYLDRTGVLELWGEKEFTPVERATARPTLEINGMISGYTGEGSKTVLPAHAMAKISCRLVPDQKPEEVHQQMVAYLNQHAPKTIRWELTNLAGSVPSISNRNSKWVKAYIDAAQSSWGTRAVFKREGGSVPVVSDFQNILDVDSINIGFGTPDDNIHGPNEKLHLPTWYHGLDALVYFLFNIAK